MLTKSSAFRVGLFMVVGIVVGVAALIYVGASRYFEQSRRYVTYFDESVSGLNPDAPVKYRGVSIGRVDRIDVAPDGRLVEVMMRLDPKIDIGTDIRAVLKQTGLTGIAFIELEAYEKGAPPEEVPELPFSAPAPVIPSRRSTISQLIDIIDTVLRRIKELDLEGVLDKIELLAKTVDTLVSDPRWGTVLGNLDSMTADLSAAGARLKERIEDPEIDRSIAHLEAFLSEANQLVRGLREHIHPGHISARFDRTMDGVDRVTAASERLVEGVDRKTDVLERRLDRVMREMESMFRNLNELSKSLKERPSSLIFGPSRAEGQGEFP